MSWLRTISLRPTANQITLGRDQLYAVASSRNRLQSLDITDGWASSNHPLGYRRHSAKTQSCCDQGFTLLAPRRFGGRKFRRLRSEYHQEIALRLRAFRADDLLATTIFPGCGIRGSRHVSCQGRYSRCQSCAGWRCQTSCRINRQPNLPRARLKLRRET